MCRGLTKGAPESRLVLERLTATGPQMSLPVAGWYTKFQTSSLGPVIQALIPVKNTLLMVWIFHQSFPSPDGCASGVLSEHVFIFQGKTRATVWWVLEEEEGLRRMGGGTLRAFLGGLQFWRWLCLDPFPKDVLSLKAFSPPCPFFFSTSSSLLLSLPASSLKSNV